MDFVSFARENWDVIAQAPWAFVICAGLCLAIGFAVSSKLTSERLALAHARIEDYKDKLSGKSPIEAAARIAKLEATIALMSPLATSDEQSADMARELRRVRSGVRINRDVSSSNVDHAYRQMIALFASAGWSVEDGVIMGRKETPPCGLQLILRPNMDDQAVDAIRSALEVAGLVFEETNEPDRGSGIVTPQLLLTSPWDPARWG